MTFFDWMMENYLGEDTAEGDLAEDMHHENDFPKTDEYSKITFYLRQKHACRECLEVFRSCWKEYKGEMR